MAERRMFTKKITDSDAFIELSSSAQALYFHLNQGADDDGFNNQIQNAMFKSHSTIDDLKVLMLKNFIIRFDSGVIVIKHWRMHNTLRKDRYTRTNFQEELKCLGIEDNGSYTLYDAGCHLVAKRLPQDSIGKDSIGKDNIYSETQETEKNKYADFVTMTEEEYNKLVGKYGREFTNECITVLDNYKGANGKKYKNDYRAILNWVVKRVEQEGKVKPSQDEDFKNEIVCSDDIFTDEEYSRIIRGKMSKEEQLRIIQERTGEKHV